MRCAPCTCAACAAFVGATMCVTACSGLGPSAIRAGRTEYNIALARTKDEQLLLNIVRLRYGDPTYFLEATSLTTQFLFSPELSASAAFGPGLEAYGVRGSYLYEEKPTITYVPLAGEDYVKRVLTPVELGKLLLLSNSGWSVERILLLCVDELNGLPNAPTASGPTPSEQPDFARFKEVAELLRALQKKRAVNIAYREEPGQEVLVPFLQFDASLTTADEFERLTSLLDLDPNRTSFRVSTGVGHGGQNAIFLETRSYVSMLFFVSQSVEIPPDDIAAERVATTRTESGRPFEWADVTGSIMRIRSSKERPTDAMVAVHYRGTWFYVDDSDTNSKSTFILLSQLGALQSGRIEGGSLLLTLPL